MKRTLLVLIFLVALPIGLIALMPLSLVLDWAKPARAGFSAAAASGTIWDGRVAQAWLSDLFLGDAKVGLQPLSLLSGRPQIGFRLEGGDFSGDGALALGRNGAALRLRQGRLDVVNLNFPAIRTGELRFANVSVDFQRGACRMASGAVETDILEKLGAGWNLRAPLLKGNFACVAGAAEAPMQGNSEIGSVTATLRVQADGLVRITTRVATQDPIVGPLLGAAGFSPGAEGFSRAEESRLFNATILAPGPPNSGTDPN